PIGARLNGAAEIMSNCRTSAAEVLNVLKFVSPSTACAVALKILRSFLIPIINWVLYGSFNSI
ncbi:MAG: hypothetical protein WBX25_13625, partial [Rhodomicrobium sp.]